MNKQSIKHILVAALVTAAIALGSQSAFAQTWVDNDTNNQWNDANNWSPATIPNAAGATATLTYPGGNFNTPLTVVINGAAGSVTVGTLNIGAADGTTAGDTAGIYSLNNDSNGDTLTLNSGTGSGAAINEISTAAGDNIGAPIILADAGGLNITDSSASTTGTFYINGGITGTGNVTITNNSSNTGNTIETDNNGGGRQVNNSGLINNVGTLTIAGTGTGTVRLQGGVGSNVTQIIQNSATSQLYFAGTGISVNGTVGTTYILNAGTTSGDGGVGFTGTGNAVVDNNTANNDALRVGGANNIGTVTSDGSGTGYAEINGNVTSNVTSLIIQAGAASGMEVRGGSLTINTGGTTTLVDNSSSTTLELKQNTTGTGNLVMDNNSTASQGVQLAEQALDNTGYIINQGTGSGSGEIGNDGSSTLGSSLLGVVENSTTSSLDLRLGGSGTVVSGFTGILEVKQGTMSFSGGETGSENMSNASQIIVGDTAAHGATAFLSLNFDGNAALTLGATQTLSGFGTIENGSASVTSVSGSTIAPGSLGNIGKLTINQNVTLVSGTNLTFILGTAGGTPSAGTSSMLAVNSTLNLSATLTLNLVDNAGANSQGSLGAGDYELASYNSLTGATLGDITSMFSVNGPAGFAYEITDTSITGPGQIDLSVLAVPEPSTWAMLLGGFVLLVGMQKLRRRRI